MARARSKRRRNLWPFDAFTKSTVYHLRGRAKGVKESSTTRYKGYAIYRRAEGFTVPALDRESIFDDKREAKRFIDAMRKGNPKRKRNADIRATWHGKTMAFDTISEAQAWLAALRKLYKKDPDAAEQVAYAGHDWREKLNQVRKTHNPTLSLPRNKFVQAKVRMKGGKIQVLVDESLLGHAGASGHVSLNPRYVITRHPSLTRFKAFRHVITAKDRDEANRKTQRLAQSTGKDYYVYGPVGNPPRKRKTKRKTARRHKR